MKRFFTIVMLAFAVIAVNSQVVMQHTMSLQTGVAKFGNDANGKATASDVQFPTNSVQRASAAITTFPYVETFDSPAAITAEGWTIVDSNPSAAFLMQVGTITGLNPVSPPSYLISGYYTAGPRNAWAFSPAMQLTAGTQYHVYIYAYGAGYQGKLDEYKITVGSAQTAASQTNIVINKTGANAVALSVWTLLEGTFTPTTSGTYYFGINHCTSVADVNGVAFDDFVVSEGVYAFPPIISTASFGGLWSATDESAEGLAYTKGLNYWGTATNAVSTSWNFDAGATNVTPLPDDVTFLTYTAPGMHTATFNVAGTNGNNYSQDVKNNIVFPSVGLNDLMWTILPTDGLGVYTFTTNNYVAGLNNYYQIMAERFELPTGTIVSISAVDFLLYYYTISTANRTKTCTIKIYNEDAATHLPGTVIATFTPTFSTLFGNSSINAAITEKTYTFTPVEVTGTFYISIDLSNMGTQGTTQNRLCFIHAAPRDFSYSTAYAFMDGEWTDLTTAMDGFNASFTFMPTMTYTYIPAPALAIVSRTPAANATGVELNTEVSVTFSQDITAAGALTGITINGDAVTASVSGSKLTINHGDFANNTLYTVTIPANTITGYADPITWSFTTVVGAGMSDVKGNDINIFQNNGGINVSVSEDSYIRVLDIFGRMLGSYNVGANSTLTFTQPAGFYIIDIQSNSGIYTYKVVVR